MITLAFFLPRPPMRCYALLDAQGTCRALRQSRQAPSGDGWVEIRECRPTWLQQPLPTDARLDRRASTRSLAA